MKKIGVVEYWSNGLNPTLHHSNTPALQPVSCINRLPAIDDQRVSGHE
jgi:hypothetical protein